MTSCHRAFVAGIWVHCNLQIRIGLIGAVREDLLQLMPVSDQKDFLSVVTSFFSLNASGSESILLHVRFDPVPVPSSRVPSASRNSVGCLQIFLPPVVVLLSREKAPGVHTDAHAHTHDLSLFVYFRICRNSIDEWTTPGIKTTVGEG
jgi:hypothetical protein